MHWVFFSIPYLHDLKARWSPGSWRVASVCGTRAAPSCTCPRLSSPDQPAVHSSSSICRWSPGVRLRGARHRGNDRWFIWVSLPLWLEESGGRGDKEKDWGRSGADDPPLCFHSQSCPLQITRKWLRLTNAMLDGSVGFNPYCMVIATVGSRYSIGWNIGWY